MGTTLTGTTPQDTYDSLIKVTDNGPLTTSLKVLTDGLGNDSTLSLSQTAASIAGTLAVAGASTFSSAITMASGGSPRLTLQDTDAGAGNVGILFQESTSPKWTLASVGGGFLFFNEATASNAISVSSTNNVGIGTTAPEALLDLYNTSGVQLRLANATTGTAALDGTRIYLSGSELFIVNRENAPIKFFTSDIERFAITNNGVTFNGDTAAANALDDYEEGEWTMGVSFGGASVDVTYSANTGTYTKIGRQVTANGYLALTNKGSSTGQARITGLPFTIGATSGFFSTAGVWMYEVSFANQFQAYGELNTTGIVLSEVTEAGAYTVLNDANFANNTEIMISLTYFV
jgi:hypothetical protein